MRRRSIATVALKSPHPPRDRPTPVGIAAGSREIMRKRRKQKLEFQVGGEIRSSTTDARKALTF